MHSALPCTGGAVTVFTVPNTSKLTTKWQVTFTGRATLIVTVKVRPFKGEVLETPADISTLNLATDRTLLLDGGMLDEIVIDDTANAAAASFVAEITSLN